MASYYSDEEQESEENSEDEVEDQPAASNKVEEIKSDNQKIKRFRFFWIVPNFKDEEEPFTSPTYDILGSKYSFTIDTDAKQKLLFKGNVETTKAPYQFEIAIKIHSKYNGIEGKFPHQVYEDNYQFQVKIKYSHSYFVQQPGFLYDGALRISFDLAVSLVPPSFYSGKFSKKFTGYVGLKNQGATCYMNSMLQALYHLPAFRRIVYQMPTTGVEDPEKCIPLNLQRLFCRLQLSDAPCSTKPLTVSFGWTDMDTFMQHDVQEFCRVLVDNLEMKLKGTPLEKAIPNIFKGKTRSYIRCPQCSFKTEHEDEFYDLSLMVRDCPTLRDSFAKYVEKEKLEGNNQYDTGTKEFGKQDAEMGVEFIEFPPILHLHLRRFEYDFETDMMEKINSKFEFPPEIDLSEFLAPDADRSKPPVYELVGVLVHWGTVAAGHYYAFLRTGTSQWYKFDDDSVSKEEASTAIEDNYGGPDPKYANYKPQNYGYYSNYYNYNYRKISYDKSYSGYMLVYARKVDMEWLYAPISDMDIPQHLKDFNQQEEEQKKAKSEQKKTEASSHTFYYATEEDVKQLALKGSNNVFPDGYDFYKRKGLLPFITLGLTETAQKLYEQISETLKKPINSFRIWCGYSNSKSIPYKLIQSNELTINKLITNSYYYKYTTLFIQDKKPEEPLEVPNDSMLLSVSFFFPLPKDSTKSNIQFLGIFIVDENQPISSLFPIISEKLHLKAENFPSLSDNSLEYNVYLENLNSQPKKLDCSFPFSERCYFISNGSVLDVEFKSKEDNETLKKMIQDGTFEFELSDAIQVEEKEEETAVSYYKTQEEIKQEKEWKEKLSKLPKIDTTTNFAKNTFSQWYQSKKSSILLTVIDFNQQNEPLVQLKIVPSVSVEFLKGEIVKAMKLNYDEEKDTVLLYLDHLGKITDKPLDEDDPNCLKEKFFYYKEDRKVFFLLLKDCPREKAKNMALYHVSFSADSVNVIFNQKIFIPSKTVTFGQIAQALLDYPVPKYSEPPEQEEKEEKPAETTEKAAEKEENISENKENISENKENISENKENTSENKEKGGEEKEKVVEMEKIRDIFERMGVKEITTDYLRFSRPHKGDFWKLDCEEDEKVDWANYEVRVEIIPPEQRKEDVILIEVNTVDKNFYDQLESYGNPFLFEVIPDEKFSETKERLQKALKPSMSKDQFKKISFSLFSTKDKPLKDDSVLSELVTADSDYKIYMHIKNPKKASHSNESAVKIYN